MAKDYKDTYQLNFSGEEITQLLDKSDKFKGDGKTIKVENGTVGVKLDTLTNESLMVKNGVLTANEDYVVRKIEAALARK